MASATGNSTPALRRARHQAGRGGDAFGQRFARRAQFGHRFALAQLDAEGKIARDFCWWRSGPDRPIPKAPSGFRARAPSASPSRASSAKLRASSAARAFSPSPNAFDHAAGNGIDILGRAAQRHARHIVAGIGAKGESAEAGLQPRRHTAFRGDGDGGGQAARHIAREGGTGQDRQRRIGRGFAPRLRSPACRCLSRFPWRRSPAACPAPDAAPARRQSRAAPAPEPPATAHRPLPPRARSPVTCNSRACDARQEAVFAAAADGFQHILFAHPQNGVALRRQRGQRQGGAPGAGAQDGNAGIGVGHGGSK